MCDISGILARDHIFSFVQRSAAASEYLHIKWKRSSPALWPSGRKRQPCNLRRNIETGLSRTSDLSIRCTRRIPPGYVRLYHLRREPDTIQNRRRSQMAVFRCFRGISKTINFSREGDISSFDKCVLNNRGDGCRTPS